MKLSAVLLAMAAALALAAPNPKPDASRPEYPGQSVEHHPWKRLHSNKDHKRDAEADAAPAPEPVAKPAPDASAPEYPGQSVDHWPWKRPIPWKGPIPWKDHKNHKRDAEADAAPAPAPVAKPAPDASKPEYPGQSVAHHPWKRPHSKKDHKRDAEPDAAPESYEAATLNGLVERNAEPDAEAEAAPAPEALPHPAAVSDVEYVKRLAQPEAEAAAGRKRSFLKRTAKRDAAAEPIAEMGPESMEVLTA